MLRSSFCSKFDEYAIFGVPEAAPILKVHPETLRDFIRTGRLPAVRIGNRYRIGGWALNIALREGVPIDPLEAQRVFSRANPDGTKPTPTLAPKRGGLL
jgi:excisionase family DNA binding protein